MVCRGAIPPRIKVKPFDPHPLLLGLFQLQWNNLGLSSGGLGERSAMQELSFQIRLPALGNRLVAVERR